MIRIFKERRLGVAEGKRRYDLPLNRDENTDFLMLLIALMTFLAVMALAAAFCFSGMADRWSSGLENKLTVEIPAEGQDGALRKAEDIQTLEDKALGVLKDNAAVETSKGMDKSEMQGLLEPWLGGAGLPDSIQMPGIISVDLKNSDPEPLEKLRADLKAIDPTINIDANERWLGDLLRLTGALRLAALVITFIIALTTVTAVAGAVRARMAIHGKDLELLHLMGASDEYITRQFQRHMLFLSLQGGLLGLAAAAIILVSIGFFVGSAADSILPDFSLKAFHIAALALAPIAGCLIAALTARLTVMRALSRMP